MFDVDAAINTAIASKSDKEREDWNRYQEEERAKLQRIDPRAVIGVRQIEMALNEIENGNDSDFEQTRLAEGYAFLGDFQKAFDITKDELKKAEYKAVLDATDLDCACAPHKKFVKDIFPEFTLHACSSCHSLRKC